MSAGSNRLRRGREPALAKASVGVCNAAGERAAATERYWMHPHPALRADLSHFVGEVYSISAAGELALYQAGVER